MAGFHFAGSLDGSEPIIQEFVALNDAVFSRGELANLESGEAAPAATNETAYIGVAVEAIDNADDGLKVKCIINPNAIYAVEDASARAAGATLDIASGGMGVTTSSNADLLVVADSTADEPTLVTFNGTHFTQV